MDSLVYVTNNAYDSVLKVREDLVVVSAWTVTPLVMRDYLTEDGSTIHAWADHDYNGGLGAIADYGEQLSVVDAHGRMDLPGFGARRQRFSEVSDATR